MKKIILFLLSIVLVFKVQTSFCFAEDKSTGITLSPAIIEGVVTKGEVKILETKVYNTSEVPLPIKTKVEDLFSADEDVATNGVQTAKDWIQVEPSDFILQPKQAKLVRIQIFPPIDAPPGGHYASVIFQPLVQEGAVSTGALSVPRISVQLMLIVKGDIQENLEVKSLVLSKVWFGEKNMEVEVNLINKGNTHNSPNIYLEIENKKIIISDKKIILPGKDRQFSASIQPGGWGKKKVNIYVKYGSKEIKILNRYVYFLPSKVQLILFVVLTILVIFTIMNYTRVVAAFRVLLHGR